MRQIRVLFALTILLVASGYAQDYARALINGGNDYYRKGQFALAILEYDKLIKFDSSHVEAYLNRGNSYNQLDNYPKAIADYSKAISLDPKNFLAFYGRGLAFVMIEEYVKAISDFKSALRINPKHAPAKQSLAEVEQMVKTLEEYHPGSVIKDDD
jgi:tetratricopeptide (TPR) repeat protein